MQKSFFLLHSFIIGTFWVGKESLYGGKGMPVLSQDRMGVQQVLHVLQSRDATMESQ